ncbi:hypothetical protein [Methyloceanibacter methanicus]|uniref:hypothetical protein n=1 Tax=Methyloceanibacter methanicus TaxID=1774968 RepID=UPI0013012BC5
MDIALDQLCELIEKRARSLLCELKPPRRLLLAIVGPPGVGKSTLSKHLLSRNAGAPLYAQLAPMDGFHLPNRSLAQLGLLEKKGVPETFDVGRYLALLEALRSGECMSAPAYSRISHEPVPNAYSFNEHNRTIIAEGNYLLLNDPEWTKIADLVDFSIMLDEADDVLVSRLCERYARSGRSEADALARARGFDMNNAALVRSRSRSANVNVATDQCPVRSPVIR